MLEPLLSKYSDPLKSVDNIEDLVKVISSYLESEDFYILVKNKIDRAAAIFRNTNQ